MVHPVMAKIALLCDIFVHVITNGIIRAFLHAGLTPGAQVIIHDDYSVISFANSLFRADIGTGRFIAVPA
jgi:hypothetical protein